MSAARRIVVGLSGATCSGKTTLARMLAEDVFAGGRKLNQDDFYHDENHSSHVMDTDLGHFNWELRGGIHQTQAKF
jgi:uridine kinase